MSLTRLVDLADLSPEQVHAWFASEDPVRIVEMVGAATDKELVRLVAVPELRHDAVREVLGRLGEFAVPDRLAAVRGVVEFRVTPPRGADDVAVLAFDGTGVRLLEEGAEHHSHVTVRLAAVDFLRLVTGGVNAAALLLGARLAVEGETALALAVGGVFQVPGRPGVAVDPDEVDPEEIAVVLKGVKDAHLRGVMQGGFRDVVLGQVFGRFPDFLIEDKARGADLSVGFKVTGRPDGAADRYVVHVRDGVCEVEEGGLARDATLVLDGAALLKLVTGHLNPVVAVMRGAIKIRGDMSAGLALHRMMRVPGQTSG
jgi:putative sterol carrier protein